jgi:hypothetical protein
MADKQRKEGEADVYTTLLKQSIDTDAKVSVIYEAVAHLLAANKGRTVEEQREKMDKMLEERTRILTILAFNLPNNYYDKKEQALNAGDE